MVGEARVNPHRPQVGEDAQPAAQPQQARLAALLAAEVVPLRSTDGAEQDGVGPPAGGEGRVGERPAGLVDGAATHRALLHGEVEPGLVADQREDGEGHLGDLRPHAVAGQ